MSYLDVITDVATTAAVAGEYHDISEEEEAAIKSLYGVHEVMINNWLGHSGEAFRALAGSIEYALQSAMTFSFNAEEATEMMIINAQDADEDSASSIDVDTGNGEEAGG